MKYTKLFFQLGVVAFIITMAACKKNKNTGNSDNSQELQKTVVKDVVNSVIVPTYTDMNNAAQELLDNIAIFNATPSEINLTAVRNSWKKMRSIWEQSEGFLFGPVASKNIDPRIDTWPINNSSLDSILNNRDSFPAAYIATLEDGLRGFHPIEYLLWGANGNKQASEITAKEKLLITALAENLKLLSHECITDWNSGYNNEVINPGNGSTYPTYLTVYEEIVNAMAGICSEVAEGKMGEPLQQNDPSLEESPFAKNSLTDFKNNILSVRNLYKGNYSGDGKGVEDFVKNYNLSLHNKINMQIDAALTALNNITVPFGEAISAQPVQVQNAITAIDNLGKTLTDEVLPLVGMHIKN